MGRAGEDCQPALFLASAGGVDGIGRVGGVPSYVGSWTVGGRHRFVQKAEIDGELGAVMGGVKDTSPENPNALAADIEERDYFEPPGFGLHGEEIETLAS